MAVAKALDVRARSVELAQARGYHGSGPARSLGATFGADGQLVALAVRVPSASGDNAHIVTYQTAGEIVTCDCPSSQYGRACWHKGVGLRAGRYLARWVALGYPED